MWCGCVCFESAKNHKKKLGWPIRLTPCEPCTTTHDCTNQMRLNFCLSCPGPVSVSTDSNSEKSRAKPRPRLLSERDETCGLCRPFGLHTAVCTATCIFAFTRDQPDMLSAAQISCRSTDTLRSRGSWSAIRCSGRSPEITERQRKRYIWLLQLMKGSRSSMAGKRYSMLDRSE